MLRKGIRRSASGDPHITSVFGCKIDAPMYLDARDDQESVLMDCGNEKLSIHYKRSWSQHITQVDVYRKDGILSVIDILLESVFT